MLTTPSRPASGSGSDEGLEFIASYTYGKALSDNVGYYGTGWGQTGAQGYYYLDSPTRGATTDDHPTMPGIISAWPVPTSCPSARAAGWEPTGTD